MAKSERTCKYATYARVKSYLLYNGADFWGYSPVIPSISFYGRARNPGVFASYVHLDGAITSTLQKLYRFIGPTNPPRTDSLWPGYGCPHVPLRESVNKFVRQWKSIPSAALASSTLSELAEMLNGYTAGVQLLCCVLCSGTRNNPGGPPANAECWDSFFVNMEKDQPVLINWPVSLQKCLKIYCEIERRFLELAARGGCAISVRPASDAYTMYELTQEGRCVRPRLITPSSIVVALENCRLLTTFSEWHPNALRAFGMTELYSSGRFHSHEIEAFYGRTIASLNPLQIHRLEPADIKHIRRRIEDYFCTLIGL